MSLLENPLLRKNVGKVGIKEVEHDPWELDLKRLNRLKGKYHTVTWPLF